MNQVTFSLRGDEVAIAFRYDPVLVDVARGLPSRRFDPDTKEWLVPQYHCHDAVKAFEAAPCIVHVEPEVESLLTEPPGGPSRAPRARVYKEGEEYVIDFPYDARVVRAVKSIPGRRFDSDRKLWLVGITDPAGTLKEILRQLRFAECEVELDDALGRFLAP
jgi:hypothetical protein